MIYAPLLSDPPLATYKEMQDGTYDLEDVLMMNLLLQFKNKVNK
jgi:hypothetical protein